MVVDPPDCLGTDNLRSGNTLGTERAEIRERTRPLVGTLRPAVKDKPSCVVRKSIGLRDAVLRLWRDSKTKVCLHSEA